MPSLSDSIVSQQQLSEMGYRPVEPSEKPYSASTPSTNYQPGLNAFLRCPLPPIWQTTSDTLRQFYQNNQVPQVRLFNPPTDHFSGGNVTNNTFVTSSSSSGGSGGSSVATLAIASTSLKTSAINAGAKFVSSFSLSKAFELLSLTASSPCRIQLYGTQAAQIADSTRALDVSPPAGTAQNIICDVVLDTTPLIWSFQNREGANGDNPVTSKVYITVTNLDLLTDIITLSISYIPIVV